MQHSSISPQNIPPLLTEKNGTPQVHLLMGKGGVGRSTLAALMALEFVSQGHRTLLMEVNTQPKIGQLISGQPLNDKLTNLLPSLSGIHLNPESCLREYALLAIKLPFLYKAVFGNPIVRNFLRFIPTLGDFVMCGKTFFEARRDNHWSRLILDLPATGHALAFLQAPRGVQDTLAVGPMRKHADQMDNMFKDPARTIVHLVTLPEELPVQETIETVARLKDTLRLRLGNLFINRVNTPPPALHLKAWSGQLSSKSLLACGAVTAATDYQAIVARQTHQLKNLANRINLPSYLIPQSQARLTGLKQLQQIRQGIQRLKAPPEQLA